MKSIGARITLWYAITATGTLACLFIAELFTFTALAHFEDAIKAIVVLSLFVPLCISTGGSTGRAGLPSSDTTSPS